MKSLSYQPVFRLLFVIPMLLMVCALMFTSGTPTQAQATAPFRVYMTFQDGPTDAYTPGILDTLAQYGAKATFLINGWQIKGHEAILQREVREGHTLVNHLWEEPGHYAGNSEADIIESYLKTEAAIREALGELAPVYDAQIKMFWQPGGSAQPLPYIEGVQVITYNWNVNSDDCGWGMPASIDRDSDEFDQAVIANVLGESVENAPFYNPYNVYDYGDGVVIDFHDINRVTGRVLPIIMSELQSYGATFEALPRPWDQVGTMPIHLGEAPVEGAGVAGFTLNATTLNWARLRTTPSLNGDILNTLPIDTTVTAIGRTDGWIQVQFEGVTGWVSRDLVFMKGAIPNLPAVNP